MAKDSDHKPPIPPGLLDRLQRIASGINVVTENCKYNQDQNAKLYVTGTSVYDPFRQAFANIIKGKAYYGTDPGLPMYPPNPDTNVVTANVFDPDTGEFEFKTTNRIPNASCDGADIQHWVVVWVSFSDSPFPVPMKYGPFTVNCSALSNC